MNQLTVAKRYAAALFRLSEGQGLSEQVLAILENLHELTRDNYIRSALTSPIVKIEAKKAIFSDIFSKVQAPALLSNFFNELIEASRLDVVTHLYPVFLDMYNDARGIVAGELMTVVPLSDSDLERIKQTYQKKLGKKILLTQVIDPSILGGFKLKVKNQLIDLSLRTELDQITRTAVL